METEQLYIILPMYNEELSIPGLRQMFVGGLALPNGWDYHLLIVNDGSTDRTLELVGQWQAETNDDLTVVTHTYNQGLGEAILTGFREAIGLGATCILTMDADASHPAHTINQLAATIAQGADIVIASRFAPGGHQYGVNWYRQLFSLGARLVLSSCFPLNGVRDYTVSFRAYRASLIDEALQRSHGQLLVYKSFASAAELLLKTATLAGSITEVPLVLHYEDKKSNSKLRIWHTIRDYLRLLFLPKAKCSSGTGLKITT